jgi:Kef-type K+ transport system membrane component KefB
MNIMWNYVAVGLLTVAAATVVVIGAPASAELKLVEAAKNAAAVGVTAICFLASPASITSTPDKKMPAP